LSDEKSPEPVFIKRALWKDAVTEEGGRPTVLPWIQSVRNEAFAAGVAWIRITHTPDDIEPKMVLFEGWKVRPKDEGPPRFEP